MKRLKAALVSCDPTDWETRDELYDRIDRQRILEQPAPLAAEADTVIARIADIVGGGFPIADPTKTTSEQ